MKRAGPSRRDCLAAALAWAGGVAWAAPAGTRQSALSHAERHFWQQQFERLDGTALATRSLQGKLLLLNFWATWCPPCVQELPLLNTFYRQNRAKGWQVLGLAVDRAVPVTRFLARSPLDFPQALVGFAGLELSQMLGNQTRALPFSVVFGPSGEVLRRRMGRLTEVDLRAWAPLSSSES